MAKPLGSQTFGTDNIRTDEAVILIQSIRKSRPDVAPEEALATVEFVDDCLSLFRVRSISNSFRRTSSGAIRKNSAFSDLISNRLDHYIQEVREIRGVDSLVEDEEVENG